MNYFLIQIAIFMPKMAGVTRGSRILHNEELGNLFCSMVYYSSDHVKDVEASGTCSTHDGGG